jgi:galactokinase
MRDTEYHFAPPPDAETQWREFEQRVQMEEAVFFDGTGPIVGARAPGRLDIMGGVADYSGSLVMEMPIAEAACVAWQWRDDRLIRIRSTGLESEGLTSTVTLSLEDLVTPEGQVRPVAEVRERLTHDPHTRWAAYIAGCYYVMLAAYAKVSQGKVDMRLGEQGANVLLQSDVPLGAGVSSSAAIEVAAMHALSDAAGVHPSDLTLAAWCQRVENSVVGAPCGIMDQVTSALGKENALIVLRCQPHDLLGTQRIPRGWRFIGLDSRVKHSVGGSHYTRARVGAFMGLKIIQLESGGKLLENYLCRMSPAEFAAYREFLPEALTGQEYHDLYGLLPDRVTRVDPAEDYRPRACAEHPILENDRVRQFFGLMQIACLRQEEQVEQASNATSVEPPPLDLHTITEAGKLMYESHASYSDRLDLGSPETDLLVALIRKRGPEYGLYGAKITGGGSGGTVAILCAETLEATKVLRDVCREYEQKIGLTPRVFAGSSPGAVSFGARQILRG